MILVIGTVDEPVTAHFLAHLALTQRDFLFVDSRELGSRIHLELHWRPGRPGRRLTGEIHFPQWKVSLSEVSGIYSRLGTGQEGAESGQPRASELTVQQAHAWTLLDMFEGPVANRPSAMQSNDSKPCQYGAILRAGLRLPDTHVGGRLADLERFASGLGEAPIVKSTSGERSVAKQVPVDAIRSMVTGDLMPPHQFQERAVGTNVRVHLVGRTHAFACRAETDALDYRHPDRSGHTLELRPMRLPEAVTDACRRLAGDLGVDFAGIDLIEPVGGSENPRDWWCLEVNTAPGYSWFEEHSGLPIARSLADYLSSSSE